MLMWEEWGKRLDHNYDILHSVTKLEEEAWDSIGDQERFEDLMKKIDDLQRQYIRKEDN